MCLCVFSYLLFGTMSFFVWFFLISFATRFLCKNVLTTSLFPPFVPPLSICSLFVCTLVFVVSFTCFSLLFLTSFFFVFSLSLFLHAKHCAKKIYLFRLQQNSLFLSSLFHQKSYVFSVSFFVEPFFYIDLCSMFFCLFLCLEKWFLILFHSFFYSSFLALFLFFTPFL